MLFDSSCFSPYVLDTTFVFVGVCCPPLCIHNALCASHASLFSQVTICPTESTADEAMSSLYFAQRLRSIEMGVAAKKIKLKNNLDENKKLQQKINGLLQWRKKTITELEELRTASKTKEKHTARREDQQERMYKQRTLDLEGR